MRPESPKLLEDVRQAARFILDHTADLDFDGYARDEVLHSAVERKFEIIGEALNRLARSDAQTSAALPDLPRIVAFRNVLAHGYDVINHARVWDAVRTSLPLLHEQVMTLLAQAPPPQGRQIGT